MKVLISKGFGAGWSTWADGNPTNEESQAYKALTYQPIIDAIESGEWDDTEKRQALRSKAEAELGAVHEGEIYMGGFDNLILVDVFGPFYVREYDGSESIVGSDSLVLGAD
jgi:hypothetical protein